MRVDFSTTIRQMTENDSWKCAFPPTWEQRKLGDISEIKTGPFGSTLHADDYVSDGIPIITTEHFKTGSLPIDKCGLPQVSENDFSRLSAYILNAGDIVFSRVGSVDINALITPFQSTWLFSGRVLRVRPQNKNSSQFLHTLLETEDVKNDIRTRAVGQTMPSINTEILKTTPLRLPESTLEQEQLGKYFLNLDTLITLHQRKYEKLVNIKKSMLDKMFPKNGASVPEIRFKGFTDLWEQRKLEEYLEVSGQKNFEGIYTKEDVLSVSGDFGIVNQIEFQGRSFAGASVANYGVVETGDIVYTKSPLKSNPYGIIKANKGKNGIVSTLYAVYKPKQSANPEFVQIYFEQDARMNNYMHPLVNKGAKNDMKVSAENALKGQIVFPDIKEQRTISEFFRNLDTLITLHQRKLEKLQNIKKSCLEKMFV